MVVILVCNKVHQIWMEEDKITSKYPSLESNGLQQVKACIVIGLKCVEAERTNRPTIEDIVKKLNAEYVEIFEKV